MKKLFAVITILFAINLYGQKKVAITIDDVPNIKNESILAALDSMNIPVAIFINEKYVDGSPEGQRILEEWISKDWITPGNHSYSHARYSEVGLDSFQTDIEKGELHSLKLASNFGKEIKYFRFPFNDLGKDSIQHVQIREYLYENDYTSTPFTVESSDWMFNSIYRYYLKEGKPEKADSIGKVYVATTIDYFRHFAEVSKNEHGKEISQIYLCHDNLINAEYLPQVVEILRRDGYEFVNLEEALKDPLYNLNDTYYEKWGISWLYRWLPDQETRRRYFRQEPDIMQVINLYREMNNRN